MAELNAGSKQRVRGGLRRCGALLGAGVLTLGLVAAPIPAAAAPMSADTATQSSPHSASTVGFFGTDGGYSPFSGVSDFEQWVEEQLAQLGIGSGDLFGHDSEPGSNDQGQGYGGGSYPDGGFGGGEVGPGEGSGGGEIGPGQGSGGSGSDQGSVDSDAATDAESTGVVIIDTELYNGSAAAGTGIVLTSSGRVLTNYHVVQSSTEVKVTVAATGQSYDAELVGADKSSDVAVLQLDDASGLDVAAMDDDQVSVGDDVTAVGNAGGTGELTAADGKVTALDAEITTTSEDGTEGETLNELIETDADVVSGDSGGPLIDDEGEVVGIDTAASTGAEVDGYAIPIDNALQIVSKINSGQESDQVRIGPAAYLGVSVSDAQRTGSEPSSRGDEYGDGSNATTSGASVVGTTDGSPAAAAGVTEGSVITKIGSTAIDSSEELTDALVDYQPGDQVRVTWVDSSGEKHTETVTLAESPVN